VAQVVPPRSISAIARVVPSATNSGDHRRFHRPDVLLQPDHQRQVVGDAPQEGHGVVGMRVDQARHQRRLRARDGLLRRKALACFGTRQDRDDLAAPHGHGMVFQHHRMRLDRDHVTGFDQQVTGFGNAGGVGHACSLCWADDPKAWATGTLGG